MSKFDFARKMAKRGKFTPTKRDDETKGILYTDEQISASLNGKETLLVNNSFTELIGGSVELKWWLKKFLTYIDEDIDNQIKSAYFTLKYAKQKGKQRMVYAMKAKIAELKEQRIRCWYNSELDMFPTGHLEMVFDELKDWGIQLVDKRKRPGKRPPMRWHNPPFESRYYQKEMIDLGIAKGRGVFEVGCGLGKSLIFAYIIRELAVNSLVIVPSRALGTQTFRYLEGVFGSKNVQFLSSTDFNKKTPAVLKPIRVMLAQSLHSLNKKNKLKQVIQDVDAVHIDEFHHAGSNSYTALLPMFDHIYYRFGYSGTFLRNDCKTLDMLGFLSQKLYTYMPKQGIDEGFLTPVDLDIVSVRGTSHRNYQKEYAANYCGETFFDEIRKLLLKIYGSEKPSQTLILVDRKAKGGKLLHEFLLDCDIDNTFISGDDTGDHINDCIEKFNKKEIMIMIGSAVIGEGVDVYSTDNLILANGGKSVIKIVQGIGRCTRLNEGKERATVYDFCFSNTNYLFKHSAERMGIFEKYYKSGGSTVKTDCENKGG